MRKITVDPQMLDNVANRINELNDEYHRLFALLNQDVDSLQSAWQGKDNLAFTEKIKGFNDDFNHVFVLLGQYETYLKNTASAYRQTQDALVNEVNRLAN